MDGWKLFSRLYLDAQHFEKKTLLPHLYALSKSMSSFLVERISDYLNSKRTITLYESQMIRSRVMDLQKASQLMQAVIRKGLRTCQLFYKLLESCDPLRNERVVRFSASDSVLEPPLPLQNVAQIDRQCMVPTYIINIHDSTLNNCIIGSNNGQHMTTERQCPPSHNSENARHEDPERCSCRCGQQGPVQSSPAHQRLQVHSSNLEFVIIGDNNTMVVEEVSKEEEQEEQEQALI